MNHQIKAKLITVIILFITLIIICLKSNAQIADTTYTISGYELDYPSVHIKVDTLHHISQIYNFYHKKMYFAIDNRKAVLLPAMGGVTTIWREHFIIVITKKRFREIYKI